MEIAIDYLHNVRVQVTQIIIPQATSPSLPYYNDVDTEIIR